MVTRESEVADQLPRLVDASGVADRLKLDESTVRKWARLGRLPCYKLGRRVLFDVAEVARVIRGSYFPVRQG